MVLSASIQGQTHRFAGVTFPGDGGRAVANRSRPRPARGDAESSRPRLTSSTRGSRGRLGAAVGPRATFEAVGQAVAALGEAPGFVLIFPTGVDPRDASAQARAAAGDARVAGMTGSGSIGAGRRDREWLRSHRVRCFAADRTRNEHQLDPRVAGRRAAERGAAGGRGRSDTTRRSCCSWTRSPATRLRSSPGRTRSRVAASLSRAEPPAARSAPSSPTARRCPGAWSPSRSAAGRRSGSALDTAACLSERLRS